MAKGNLPPRQKMINLMYLVFIAMLAMQLDQEVLRQNNDSTRALTTNIKNNDSKINIFEETLRQKSQLNPEFGADYEFYGQIKGQANAVVEYIESLKNSLAKEAEYDPSPAKIDEMFNVLNNADTSTNMFFAGGEAAKPSKKAIELQEKVQNFRDIIVQNFGKSKARDRQDLARRAQQTLITDWRKGGTNPQGQTWMQYKFYNKPLVAAIANLEILESEVRNVQSDALSMMLSEKVDANIKFTQYEAIVSGPSAVVQGEAAQAKVFIGTYANNVDGLSMTGVSRIENGQGIIGLSSSGVGDHTVNGNVAFKDINGNPVNLPYTYTYTVIPAKEVVAVQSGVVIAADKMNILYRGVDNPVTATMLGVDNSTVSLSAPGATVSGGRGKWAIRPGAGSTVNLTISAKDPKGKPISATFPFRIKNIPEPQGQIRGENYLTLPASSVQNQTVSAAIPDFEWPVTFTVTSFMVKVPGRAAVQVSGNKLSGAADLLKNLKAGDDVSIIRIQATASGLEGIQIKKITPVVINVQ